MDITSNFNDVNQTPQTFYNLDEAAAFFTKHKQANEAKLQNGQGMQQAGAISPELTVPMMAGTPDISGAAYPSDVLAQTTPTGYEQPDLGYEQPDLGYEQPDVGYEQPSDIIPGTDMPDTNSAMSTYVNNAQVGPNPKLDAEAPLSSLMPEHIKLAEGQIRDKSYNDVGHAAVGYGINLGVTPKLGAKVLKQAGLDQATINRLLKGEIGVPVSKDIQQKASDLMYARKYKIFDSLMRRRTGKDLSKYSPLVQNLVMTLGYNGYVRYYGKKPSSRASKLTKLRYKMWQAIKKDDGQGLIKVVLADNSSAARAIKARLERGKFI